MKLIRFGDSGKEKPGVELSEGSRIDVSAFGEDFGENFFATNGIERLAKWLEENKKNCPIVNGDIRLGSPVARPSKIVCVGLNYAKHAEESGMAVPSEPVLFFKSTSSIIGPNDTVILPKDSQKSDWEVELAVIIEEKSFLRFPRRCNGLCGWLYAA